MSVSKTALQIGGACAALLSGLALIAVPVHAQTMSTSSASYEKGYGLTSGQLQNAVDPTTRDANGNRILIDGMMVTGTDNSVYAYSKTLGAGDSYSGAGAVGGATAIGNNLQVTVNGSHNTVIVHSTQINNGTVTATTNGTTTTAATGTTTSDNSLSLQAGF